MKTSVKVIGFAFGIPAAILACFFVYFIAYMSGSIPEGTRYVYKGFSFETRNGEAYELRVDNPKVVNLWFEVAGMRIPVSQIKLDDLKNAGFTVSNTGFARDSLGGGHSNAGFLRNGQIEFLRIHENSPCSLSFAKSATDSKIELPIDVEAIERSFGRPLREEYIYPKIEWR